jgi:hypothetical protein
MLVLTGVTITVSLLPYCFPEGRLAQLEERHVHTVEVGRSRLPSPTLKPLAGGQVRSILDGAPGSGAHQVHIISENSPTPDVIRWCDSAPADAERLEPSLAGAQDR